MSDLQKRMEEARAKVKARTEEIQRKLQEAKKATGSPSSTVNGNKASTSSASYSNGNGSGSGSGSTSAPTMATMGVHPLLAGLGQEGGKTASSGLSYKDRYKPLAPKFATIKANQRIQPAQGSSKDLTTALEKRKKPEAIDASTINPYFTPPSSSSIPTDGPRERTRKVLKFAQKGKYIAQANTIRNEQRMEDLRRRIQESAKKAGIESQLELAERALKRERPPEIEWWDRPLYPEDLEQGLVSRPASKSPLITFYVQHPIPIPPPGQRDQVDPKPLILTKKERKKLRRQTRLEALKERQDQQRLGLIPPDPPKIKLSNLMRVIGNDAIQDPTAIEAKVRREVQERQDTHERTNAEKKLSKEERDAKRTRKMEEDEKKGLVSCIFKIRYLSHTQHKFKVEQNAKQLNLTGMVILNPYFSLVLVEGAPKMMKKYKALMLRRIVWTDMTKLPSTTEMEDGMELEVAVEPDDEPSEPINPALNTCELIWEGSIKTRSYRQLRFKKAPTDSLARDALGKANEGAWDLAKKWMVDGV